MRSRTHENILTRFIFHSLTIPVLTLLLRTFATALGIFAAALPALGQTWTTTGAPLSSWSAVASSADGSMLIAAEGDVDPYVTPPYVGGIYTSSDGGATWAQTSAPSSEWSSLATSADGSVILAGINTFPSFTVARGLYTSTDYGATWTSNYVRNYGYLSVAVSADGSKMFAMTYYSGGPGGSNFCVSTNFGATWTLSNTGSYGWSMACSADGSRLVMGANPGFIYTSTNSGLTWLTNDAPNSTWLSVASSADGTVLVAANNGSGGVGNVYTSTNLGVNWRPTSLPGLTWQNVVISADGTKMAASAWKSGNKAGPVYTSTNSGVSWASNNIPNQLWLGLASSADGNKFFAATFATNGTPHGSGAIWTGQTLPAPELSIATSATNLDISWLMPSRNFVLQQSADLVNWEDSTNAPVLNLTDLHYNVSAPMDLTGRYFRLISEP